MTQQYKLQNFGRKNFINAQYLLCQLLKNYNYPCNKDYFVVPKPPERKARHNNICKTLVDASGWKYVCA
jgi:hypothetical protein